MSQQAPPSLDIIHGINHWVTTPQPHTSQELDTSKKNTPFTHLECPGETVTFWEFGNPCAGKVSREAHLPGMSWQDAHHVDRRSGENFFEFPHLPGNSNASEVCETPNIPTPRTWSWNYMEFNRLQPIMNTMQGYQVQLWRCGMLLAGFFFQMCRFWSVHQNHAGNTKQYKTHQG